jgi:8-oxo-dGTP pyrophosphatase MutT (NUDIX family)
MFLFTEDTKRLLIVHPTHALGNQWSIPKGELEKGEENYPWRRAYIELKEETNIDISYLQGIYSLGRQPYEKNKNKQLYGFAKTIESWYLDGVFIRCNSLVDNKFPEVDGFAWVSLDLASKLIHESQVKLIPKLIKVLKEDHIKV